MGTIAAVENDDAALLERWKAGERLAGDALFQRHFEGVFRFFRNKTDDVTAEELSMTFDAMKPKDALVCGRFEGMDERVLEHYGVTEVSLGDFVLTGGEIAAQALIDASVRLIPRVLGNHESVEEESFSHGLLEHPQYTKPPVWNGRAIPEILLSGHHAKITGWQRSQAERLTKERRPDLWRAYCAAHGRDPDEDQEL